MIISIKMNAIITWSIGYFLILIRGDIWHKSPFYVMDDVLINLPPNSNSGTIPLLLALQVRHIIGVFGVCFGELRFQRRLRSLAGGCYWLTGYTIV